MNFSENTNYLDYMRLFGAEDYPEARAALMRSIQDFGDTTYQKAFLLKRVADIFFLEGEIDRSLEYYLLSEKADASSLQPKLHFAMFMAHQLGAFKEAIDKCNQILSAAKSHPFEEAEDEFGSDYYAAKVAEIKQFCEAEIAGK
ncbi:hypothetical protein [Dyella silvatica]|uniref:hypothetical protein n=1 Tax=Dyella silvatica TaxID=2992128 RepID=UPI00225A5A4B|nr:hypothetical protein [Dyella silvatica]